MSTKINTYWDEVILDNDVTKTFVEIAEDSWKEILSSCKSGYCMVCACKVKKGKEFINKELKGAMIATWNDDLVLTCIAWPTDKNAEIELESL